MSIGLFQKKLQTEVLRIYIRGQNNAWSSEMTKHIYHLIGHKFSQFEALFGHFMYKNVNYLPNNVLYLFSAGCHVCL